VQALDNYSVLYTKEKRIVYSYPLKKVIEKISSQSIDFYRIHRSYFVNLNHITEVKHKELVLTNQAIVPISDSRKQDVLNQLNLL